MRSQGAIPDRELGTAERRPRATARVLWEVKRGSARSSHRGINIRVFRLRHQRLAAFLSEKPSLSAGHLSSTRGTHPSLSLLCALELRIPGSQSRAAIISYRSAISALAELQQRRSFLPGGRAVPGGSRGGKGDGPKGRKHGQGPRCRLTGDTDGTGQNPCLSGPGAAGQQQPAACQYFVVSRSRSTRVSPLLLHV